VSQTAEQFLSTLHPLNQRFLKYDWSCLTDLSFSLEEVSEFCKWLEEKERGDRQEYERRLKQDRPKWNEYCRAARQIDKQTARFRIAPRGMPGRKTEVELAERIWKLHAEGKTVPQIQAILEAEKKSYSREAIAAYLKGRRREPQK
jgi:hypothetical protein